MSQTLFQNVDLTVGPYNYFSNCEAELKGVTLIMLH